MGTATHRWGFQFEDTKYVDIFGIKIPVGSMPGPEKVVV